MKVWFQNRRTKHKREETETDQQKALSGQPGGHHMEDQTILEHEESEEEDIDCEWGEALELFCDTVFL